MSMEEKAVLDEKAKVWERVMERERKKHGAIWWKVDDTNEVSEIWLSQTAIHVSPCALKMPLLMEEKYEVVRHEFEILCWNETGRLGWENERNLFVVWRRILGMLVLKEHCS